MLTSVFNDDDFSKAGKPVFIYPSGYDVAGFNNYKMVWKPDRVQWFVIGVLRRTERSEVPDQKMNLRLNFWAPDAHFTQAYDGALKPASSAATNKNILLRS